MTLTELLSIPSQASPFSLDIHFCRPDRFVEEPDLFVRSDQS